MKNNEILFKKFTLPIDSNGNRNKNIPMWRSGPLKVKELDGIILRVSQLKKIISIDRNKRISIQNAPYDYYNYYFTRNYMLYVNIDYQCSSRSIVCFSRDFKLPPQSFIIDNSNKLNWMTVYPCIDHNYIIVKLSCSELLNKYRCIRRKVVNIDNHNGIKPISIDVLSYAWFKNSFALFYGSSQITYGIGSSKGCKYEQTYNLNDYLIFESEEQASLFSNMYNSKLTRERDRNISKSKKGLFCCWFLKKIELNEKNFDQHLLLYFRPSLTTPEKAQATISTIDLPSMASFKSTVICIPHAVVISIGSCRYVYTYNRRMRMMNIHKVDDITMYMYNISCASIQIDYVDHPDVYYRQSIVTMYTFAIDV